uniref:Nik related kinase n=1 Tax=Rhinopithecus bieti TaxID=61621 RepID=A0A2K6KZ28_RHIBE
MQVPRERIKIAFRLWIPILVIRIVVAGTWPQAPGLSTLGLFECTQRTTGWGQKAIEVRSLQSRVLESELKRRSIKKLRFLCTRGDKLFFTSTLRNRHSRVYFMTLGKLEELQSNYGV